MGAAKTLWVEGEGEAKVLPILFDKKGINLKSALIKLEKKEGYTNILKAIPLEIKSADSEGLEILGIIIDADNNSDDRWKAVRNRLSQAGYKNLPVKPSQVGTIIPSDDDNDLPRVGIWLMPDNSTAGMLETLISLLVPDGASNVLWQYAEQSVDYVYNNHKAFSEARKPKAILHTWLAWQKKPGLPINTAIIAGYLNTNHPTLDDFTAWFKDLFQLT